MSDPEDMEVLAAAEHESWARWTKWMLGQIKKDWEIWGEGAVLLHGDLEELDCVKRWRRQMDTPYAELSEREKESDRKVARGKLAVYRAGADSQ